MKYQANLPQEPDGPLWDQDGSKCVKAGPGTWKRTNPDTGELNYFSWKGLLILSEHLTDIHPIREAWNQAQPGAHYWIDGFDSDEGSPAKGIGYPDKNRILHVPDAGSSKSEELLIAPSEENDDLTEITPVLAVPADDLIELLDARDDPTTDHLQAKIFDWLEDHPQVHWEERSK